MTSINWKSVQDNQGRKLETAESGDEGGKRRTGVSALTLLNVPDQFNGCTINGELLIDMVEPVTLVATVRPKEKAVINLSGAQVALRVLAEGEKAELGQRGPGFSVSASTMALGNQPKLTVMQGDQPLKFNNMGMSSSGGGGIYFFYRTQKLAHEPCVATITGQATLQQIRMPLTLPIMLGRLPTSERLVGGGLPLQVPTRIRWDAGECDVAEAVRRLATDNLVFLELGVDDRRRAQLPAFEGTFWEAVLSVCRAFDLTILPPEQKTEKQNEDEVTSLSCVTSGPVCLGQRRGERTGVDSFGANGILLVSVDALTVVKKHGLDGMNRQAELTYSLRLEPRIDASLVESAMVNWTSYAPGPDGNALVVQEAHAQGLTDDEDNVRHRGIVMMNGWRPHMRNNENESSPAGLLMVDGLPASQVRLVLSGQVSLRVHRHSRAELTLAPGGVATTRVGGHGLVVKMFSAGKDNLNSNTMAGVTIDKIEPAIEIVSAEVRDVSGNQLRRSRTSEDSHVGSRTLYFSGLEQGPYTVVMTIREKLGIFSMPIVLSATTP
jgi:hypothetical protein